MNKKTNEKQLERKLVRGVKERCGLCIKLQTGLFRGLPDRLVLFTGFPYGLAYFVEMKSPGKRPTAMQQRVINLLRIMGFSVHVIDSEEALLQFFEAIQKDGVGNPTSGKR